MPVTLKVPAINHVDAAPPGSNRNASYPVYDGHGTMILTLALILAAVLALIGAGFLLKLANVSEYGAPTYWRESWYWSRFRLSTYADQLEQLPDATLTPIASRLAACLRKEMSEQEIGLDTEIRALQILLRREATRRRKIR